MKKITLASVVGLLVLSCAAPTLGQALPGIHADLGFFSKYVWRGLVATDDWVMQPAAGVNWLGFGFDIWANADLTDVNGYESEFNEVDYTLNYTLGLPLVSLEGGIVHYSFPNTDLDSTTEVYLGAEVGVILSPSLYLYRDVDKIDGTYIEASVAYTVGDFDKAKLDLGLDLGWGSEGYNSGYFGAAGAGFNNLTVAAELPWKPIPLLTITPSIAYKTLLGDADDSFQELGITQNAWVFGINGNVSFGGGN